MKNGAELYRVIGEKQTRAHKKNRLRSSFYDAVACLEKAYDLAEDLGLDALADDIEITQQEIIGMTHAILERDYDEKVQ